VKVQTQELLAVRISTPDGDVKRAPLPLAVTAKDPRVIMLTPPAVVTWLAGSCVRMLAGTVN
jgi:hypothetical protein